MWHGTTTKIQAKTVIILEGRTHDFIGYQIQHSANHLMILYCPCSAIYTTNELYTCKALDHPEENNFQKLQKYENNMKYEQMQFWGR